MVRRSAQRLTTTFFVVLSLLFSQLALANYVCPEPVQKQAEMPAMQMADGEPCEMGVASGKAMDQEQPVLCHQHCVNAPQSFDPVQVPVVSLPAVVQVLVVPLLMDAGATESVVFAHAGRERPPPDPLFLSTLRLRV
jgi:hypothetical protein